MNLHSRSYEDFVKYVEYSPVSFYNDLIEDGYTMPPYHEFFKEIAHPNLTATDNQRKVYNALREKHSDIPENFNKFQSAISDTNTLRTYYKRMKQDGIPFLPDFKSFVVDLGLDPNQPAEKKLLL